jgi:hypothetical protein
MDDENVVEVGNVALFININPIGDACFNASIRIKDTDIAMGSIWIRGVENLHTARLKAEIIAKNLNNMITELKD